MYINPNWRVVTIGDGDLSFSRALKHHHKLKHLVATTLDSEEALVGKYANNGVADLKNNSVPVCFGVDVTDPKTWPSNLSRRFDLALFQFPLIPQVISKDDYQSGLDINTRNRRLLHLYLKHCHDYFLDDAGLGIACISSKDVKPYSQWNIETALHAHTGMTYLGKCGFDMSSFPGYQIRNVDRDKHVKDTQSYTYYWHRNAAAPDVGIKLVPYEALLGDHCPFCHAGPFATEQERIGHLASKKHKTMVKFEQDWQDYLQSQYKDNDKRET